MEHILTREALPDYGLGPPTLKQNCTGVMEKTVNFKDLAEDNNRIVVVAGDTLVLFHLPAQHILYGSAHEIVRPETVNPGAATVSFGYEGGGEFAANIDAKVVSIDTTATPPLPALGQVISPIFQADRRKVTLLANGDLNDAVIKFQVLLAAFHVGHEEI